MNNDNMIHSVTYSEKQHKRVYTQKCPTFSFHFIETKPHSLVCEVVCRMEKKNTVLLKTTILSHKPVKMMHINSKPVKTSEQNDPDHLFRHFSAVFDGDRYVCCVYFVPSSQQWYLSGDHVIMTFTDFKEKKNTEPEVGGRHKTTLFPVFVT